MGKISSPAAVVTTGKVIRIGAFFVIDIGGILVTKSKAPSMLPFGSVLLFAMMSPATLSRAALLRELLAGGSRAVRTLQLLGVVRARK